MCIRILVFEFCLWILFIRYTNYSYDSKQKYIKSDKCEIKSGLLWNTLTKVYTFKGRLEAQLMNVSLMCTSFTTNFTSTTKFSNAIEFFQLRSLLPVFSD